MELHAPGADIVGFEYEATSDEDKAKIDAALDVLSAPLDLFVVPAAARCSVTNATAELEGDDHHDHEGEHEEHDDHDEDHADHDDHGDEHADHDDHAKEADDHAEHEHDHDKDHDKHAEDGDSHTEFHAEYTLTCTAPEALDSIEFAYFEKFENALELEVQIVGTSGAQAYEVERDSPTLDLGGAL